MREENEQTGTATDEREAAGVLSNLPRTRPQRPSARRAAARGGGPEGPSRRRPDQSGAGSASRAGAAAASGPAGAGATADGSKPQKPKAKTASGARAGAAAGRRARARAGTRARGAQDSAPRQGFESEGDSATGPVTPPGPTELINAAGELLTDVAKSGLSRGASTLKGIAGRLGLR